MDFPFEQIEKEGKIVRTFNPDVEDDEFGFSDEDAEDFYKSGVLAGKKKFGDNFDPEKPKGDEQRLYSSYMSDVMHKYYNKIDHDKKGS